MPLSHNRKREVEIIILPLANPCVLEAWCFVKHQEARV